MTIIFDKTINLLNQYRTIGNIKLNFLLALYFVLILNLPIFYYFYEVLNFSDSKIGFIISLPIFLLAGLNLLFLPFSFPFIQKIFFSFLLLTSSLATYSMLKYGIIFDYGMVQNIFETTQREASEYINTRSISWFMLTGIIPCIVLLWLKIEYKTSVSKGMILRIISMIISLLVIMIIGFLYSKDYFSVGRNNKVIRHKIIPISFCDNSVKYIKNTYLTPPLPFSHIGWDAKDISKPALKPTLLFIVVGETARSSNYSLNGYKKATNFFTEKEENLISFQNVYSCGTATAVSVPCMFSNMTQQNYKQCIAHSQGNLLDILCNINISILWKENNEGCKTVCNRVPIIVVPRENNKFCNEDSCLDEALLEHLEEEVANMKGGDSRNKVVVLHLIGSHGPSYFKRYPDNHRFFTPDCRRSDIENCNDIELVNTYDNTIRYTDYVLSQLINKLKNLNKKYNTCMIYVSDHGESLGENGIYLHGLPYNIAQATHKEQILVPMIIWSSNEFNKEKGLNTTCLRNNSITQTYSHDNLFHSVLGILNIQTKEYNPALDIFATCRK